MQMRRLEERIGKPIFVRDGRASKLTEDGERLLGYARRMVRLSDETVAAFDETELSGSVRLGTPDDYADRFLPEILARFARSNPRVEVSVFCEPSTDADGHGAHRRDRPRHRHRLRREASRGGAPGAAVLGRLQRTTASRRRTCCRSRSPSRRASGATAASTRCPRVGRKYRVLYTSGNSTAISAAVLAGLAVTVLAESALRPRHARPHRGGRLPAAAHLRDRHRPLVEPADLADRRQARRAHRLLARQPVGARAVAA